MKRILILGPCGAGKSTLARDLSDILGVKVIHLDKEYWIPGWVEPDKEAWTNRVSELVEGEQWIIDGNYTRTLGPRLDRADTIIYLDYPTWRCLFRVLKRIWQYRGKVRPDMHMGCEEKFDLEFLHYVAVFNITRGKAIRKSLKELPDTKKVFFLRNDDKVGTFLNTIRSAGLSVT